MNRGFDTVYYLNFGAPSPAAGVELAAQYAAAGCRHLQLDLPTRDPYLEHDIIRSRMLQSLSAFPDLGVYLDAICALYKRLPEVKLELTAYEDTLREIGLSRFFEFCAQAGIRHVAYLPQRQGADEAFGAKLEAGGLQLLEAVPFHLPDGQVARAVAAGRPIQLMTQSSQPPRPGCETLAGALSWLRRQGARQVYVTMGIRTPQRLAEVRRAGADGAYIGSCLIEAWGDQAELGRRIAAFEQAAEQEAAE